MADLALTREKALFRSLYDFLDRSDTGQIDRLIRFRKRLEKDVEYFVRDLLQQHQGGISSRLTDKERQLRVINKKTENYQRLNDRIREDNPGIEDEVAKRATARDATGDRHRRRSRSPRGRDKNS